MNESSGKTTSQILWAMMKILFPPNSPKVLPENNVRWVHPDKIQDFSLSCSKDMHPVRWSDPEAYYFTLEGALYKILEPTNSCSNTEDFYGTTAYICKAIIELFYKNKTWQEIHIPAWESQRSRKSSDIERVLWVAYNTAHREERNAKARMRRAERKLKKL